MYGEIRRNAVNGPELPDESATCGVRDRAACGLKQQPDMRQGRGIATLVRRRLAYCRGFAKGEFAERAVPEHGITSRSG